MSGLGRTTGEASTDRAAARRRPRPPLSPAGAERPAEALVQDGQASRLRRAAAASDRLALHDVLRLQRLVGNRAVGTLVGTTPGRGPSPVAPSPAVAALQRAVYKEGGKNAVAIVAAAKTVAGWVTTKGSVQPGGRNHIANIQGRGFPGFKKGRDEYAGGRPFNNNPMPDGSRLPYAGGQTYQEWDTDPCLAGAARGADRIVTSSDGKVYYSNDHYSNFTEFKP